MADTESSINSDVLAALEDLDVPVSFQRYTGSADSYITFFIHSDEPELHADDEELVTGYYVQVDVWSKNDYTEMVKSVHEKMSAAGFRKQDFCDLYEADLEMYRKVMHFLKEVV